jgi:hypothetical protein
MVSGRSSADEHERLLCNRRFHPFNLNSEVARLCGKKPLTRLATLAALSPRERADIDQR